jgi:hypothetical protein
MMWVAFAVGAGHRDGAVALDAAIEGGGAQA